MLKGKILLDYENLFSPNDYEKNDKIIENNTKIFSISKKMEKLWYLSLFVVSTENLKNLKYYTF